MRKSTTKEDLKDDTIPKLIYDSANKKLIPWQGQQIFGYTWHHTVKQQILARRPELRKFLKLIYLPTLGNNMHAEADNKHSKFKERWGVKLSEVIYEEEE